MNRKPLFRSFAAAAAGLAIAWAHSAFAAPWNLPQAITDRNARIQYRYLSHGAATQGTVSGVTGKAWFGGGDFRQVRAELEIPVPKLSSALGDLSESFGGLLDSVALPPAHLTINRLSGICSPQEIAELLQCKATAEGQTRFGELTRNVNFPVTMTRKDSGYRLEGAGSFYPAQAQDGPSGALLSMIDKAEVKFAIELPDPPRSRAP